MLCWLGDQRGPSTFSVCLMIIFRPLGVVVQPYFSATTKQPDDINNAHFHFFKQAGSGRGQGRGRRRSKSPGAAADSYGWISRVGRGLVARCRCRGDQQVCLHVHVRTCTYGYLYVRMYVRVVYIFAPRYLQKTISGEMPVYVSIM